MKKILATVILMILFSCSNKDEPVVIPPSAENYILDFRLSINNTMQSGIIDNSNQTILFSTVDTNLENFTPMITISAKSSISPKSAVVQNFSEPITYEVTSEDGSVRAYQVSVVNQNINNENQLLTFSLLINGELTSGTIDEEERVINFTTAGADLESLIPTVQISDDATIAPSPNLAQNFNNEISYTITASDGTPSIYRVQINNRPLRSDNEIINFSVTNGTIESEAIINREGGIISFHYGDLDRTNLTPTFELSEYATISPALEVAQDFTNSVIYTVTAEDGLEFEYQVIANLPKVERIGAYSNPAKFFVGSTFSIQGEFMDINTPESQIYFYDGANKFPIDIIEASNYENGLVRIFSMVCSIPVSTPTNENYEIVYEGNGIKAVSEFNIDIKQENSPLPLLLDKEQYRYNDELILTGENLTAYIAIPAPNSSIYLFDPRGSTDISVNADQTEMRTILSIRELFPSYYGDGPKITEIVILDEERRKARSIFTEFY